jgi:beta-lactam-binding protein with PASTA domain
MIFLTGRNWSIRWGWHWCLDACLASAILFLTGCAKVTVPNVEGLTQDAATTAISGAKLKVGTITQQTSNAIATGKVISQDPASGNSVAEGSPVNLVISSGPQMVAVPKVEGLTQDAATTAITGAKLKVGAVAQQTSNTVANGKVISQGPASGNSVAEGSPVNLVISSGPQMVAVPKVEGLTQDAATTAIAGAKLKVGPVTQQTSNTVPTGKVISQDPGSGNSVAEGSPVELVISSGPPVVALPNVEGLTQDAAIGAVTGAKLKVGTVTQQTSNTVAPGKVISQEPGSGNSVAEGSLVNLVVSSGPPMVTVPNLERLTQDDAATSVTAAKLTVGTVTQQTSNTVPTGNVFSQDPASGSFVAEGSPVNLMISSGPQRMMSVPNVEGLTQAAATTAITGAKLLVGTVTQQSSSTVVTGNVISQDPSSGSSVAEGSPVNLVISSGPQMVAMPNVEGLTQAAATTAITGVKLAVGTVTQQTSNTVATGKVISQDPASGNSVAEGSPVNLVISSGPQMVAMPNVEGLTQDDATTAITGVKLTVGTITQQTSNTVATGKVMSQDPSSENSVAEGSPVNLVISSGPPMMAVPNVEGLTQDDAVTAVTGAKLTVGTVTQQTSNTVANGRVIRQDPANGSSAAEGSPVKLVISSGPPMVAVPNVEALTQADATTAITGTKLKVGTITPQTSNTVATGKVISQDPANGSSVAEGSPVNLVISSGPQMVTVPNVQGLTQVAASAAIARAKLTVGSVTATGKVISQNPASGSSVEQGSPVNLVISLGPQMVTVPNLEGLTQAAAAAAVTAANLTVGTIIRQTSNTVASGNVVRQDQPSGSSVAQGSPVNLVISSGPEMVAVPNVVELTQAEATKAIMAAKLTLGTVIQQTSKTVASGKVISQDPANGSSVAQGSPVNLVISSVLEARPETTSE